MFNNKKDPTGDELLKTLLKAAKNLAPEHIVLQVREQLKKDFNEKGLPFTLPYLKAFNQGSLYNLVLHVGALRHDGKLLGEDIDMSTAEQIMFIIPMLIEQKMEEEVNEKLTASGL